MNTDEYLKIIRLEEEVKKLQKEVSDWESSFKLYSRAIDKATKLWHESHDRHILPDISKLIDWLIQRGNDEGHIQAQCRVSKRTIPSKGNRHS